MEYGRRKESRVLSRAFVREDADNERIMVSARAPLPADTPNFVTSRGLAALQAELVELKSELTALRSLAPDAPGQARDVASARERLSALEDRIASAQLVELGSAEPQHVVIGTTVTVRSLTGKFQGEQNRFAVVGVDEADPFEALVAFTAPVAEALLGKRVGDEARVQGAGQEQRLVVVAIDRSPTT